MRLLTFVLCLFKTRDWQFWTVLVFIVFFSLLAAVLSWSDGGKWVLGFGGFILLVLLTGTALNKLGIWK